MEIKCLRHVIAHFYFNFCLFLGKCIGFKDLKDGTDFYELCMKFENYLVD